MFHRNGNGLRKNNIDAGDNSNTNLIRQNNRQNALPSAAVQSVAPAQTTIAPPFKMSMLICISLSASFCLAKLQQQIHFFQTAL